MRIQTVGIIVALGLIVSAPDAEAQYAELSGRVLDETGGVIAKAIVNVVSKAKGLKRETTTNDQGIYALPALQPDEYVVKVQAPGFQTASRDKVILEVDQRMQLDFSLEVGSVETTVTVHGESPLRTTDGSVGTVIDQKFAANLPVNGRTFGALVALAPGVTPMAANLDGGQYSVNGQRAASNYLMVDGVSANVGLGSGVPRDSVGGQRQSATITGGLNGLVVMDALQEIRIQTSSFSPEFGRTPGGQISLITRSGTNVLHGSAFEQFRDDALSANNWFLNSRSIKKSELRQHQFGATLGGPVVRNRTFFFASYEGLRLLQPIALISGVPSLEARRRDSAIRPVLEAFPEPTGLSRADGSAEYATSTSIRTTSDNWGIRVDNSLWTGAQAFARYSHAPSFADDDRVLYMRATRTTSRSFTAGATMTLGARALADLRLMHGDDVYAEDNRAKIPQFRAFFPSAVRATTYVQMQAVNLLNLFDGTPAHNASSQTNVIGSISYLFGNHHLKAGVDLRRMRPRVRSAEDRVAMLFQSVNEAVGGSALVVTVDRRFPIRASVDISSLYLQDTWKAGPRLSLSYGLRWDVNPAPSFPPNEGPLAASMSSAITDLRLLPERNRPMWKTHYDDVVPRFGFSYALDADARLTLSGGAGIFTDLSGQAAGLALSPFSVPNGTSVILRNVPLPLTPSNVQGVDTPTVMPPFNTQVGVVDPGLRTPRTRQWNLSIQRAFGGHQAISASYVGARAQRLLQTKGYDNLSRDFPNRTFVTTSTGRSTYQSLQLEYRRRAAQGLQLLASYTLGKARDTGSATFAFDLQDELAPANFDVRHVFNAAVSWELPRVGLRPLSIFLRDWALHAVGTARSGAPFTVLGTSLFLPGEVVAGRASLVPGQQVLLKDGTAPGGQRLNRAAFAPPPPGRHGDSGRNGFRGLAIYQVDMGLQRTIPLPRQSLRLLVRVDAFNVLNTPNFGLPVATLNDARFGVPTATLNESGGFNNVNSLYRSGGPRVVELTVRFMF